ncbi:MAG TPA: T9SS type A sorting domain-containing protein [Puia sp.]|nr:T9SS type A sorting domain-containing protein [Puia sp.]
MNKLYKTLVQTIRTFLVTMPFVYAVNVSAQTSYFITTNKNWSAVLPSTCAACTINVSTGVTLTIDESVTCQNCTIQGGNISMNNQTLNIQYFGGSPVTTTFSNVNFQIYGNNGKVIVNAPLSMSSSTLTFHDGSYFNTSYKVDMVSSTVNLYDAATMYSTGGSSTAITLSDNSRINVGNGSKTSTASFTVSGPTLTMFDNSNVTMGNVNNMYFNWSNYDASTAHSTNAATHSYSTMNNSLNCGGSGQHSCSMAAVYGPATLTTAGAVPGNTLPVILSGFTAVVNSDGSAQLSWETKLEQNSSRFEIERSAKGAGWSTVGTVQAKGNSATPTSYSYTDGNPLQGANYYRLKMIDLDGSAIYSDIKVIATAAVSHISFFPNPARDFVNVTLGGMSAGTVTVRLINQAGAVLQEKKAQGGTTVTFSLQQCTTGFYVLSVMAADGTHESSKLLISRM